MKKLSSILLLSLLSFSYSFAQKPEISKGINYQAVARDGEGQIIRDKSILLQFILFSPYKGENYYSETHDVTTNSLGLFSLVIGNGKPLKGDFKLVPWSTEDVWIETAIDEKNKSGFKIMNSSRLLAVPYAFHANTALELVKSDDLAKEDIRILQQYEQKFRDTETRLEAIEAKIDKLSKMITNEKPPN